MRKTSVEINEKLGVKIFDESNLVVLKLIKYTKKQIKELQIDDLIQDGKWSNRLIRLVHEIQTDGM
jgi:hypothetical protein